MDANVIDLGAHARAWHRTAQARRRAQALAERKVSRDEVLDSASRVLLRRGYQGLLFGGIARELGVPTRTVIALMSDKPELVRCCYRRSADALAAGLMAAETAAGPGIQKLDIFLGTMLAVRRERGCLLPLALADGPSMADVRWCRGKDRMIRTRIERLIRTGQADGSVRARNPVAASALILALLSAPEPPVVAGDQMADVEDLKQLIFGGLAAR